MPYFHDISLFSLFAIISPSPADTMPRCFLAISILSLMPHMPLRHAGHAIDARAAYGAATTLIDDAAIADAGFRHILIITLYESLPRLRY